MAVHRWVFPARRKSGRLRDEDWEVIKQRSQGRMARVAILGVDRADPSRILSGADIEISTSLDEVGAPLFFREVNLPFVEAVRDPAKYIRWRFGPISSKEPPPIVLDESASLWQLSLFLRRRLDIRHGSRLRAMIRVPTRLLRSRRKSCSIPPRSSLGPTTDEKTAIRRLGCSARSPRMAGTWWVRSRIGRWR